MDVKVSVHDLKYGMYINELDRPWTDTKFYSKALSSRRKNSLPS